MWGDGVDEDDEDLNENDDVEEECDIDDDNIPYLIICQFDNVICCLVFFSLLHIPPNNDEFLIKWNFCRWRGRGLRTNGTANSKLELCRSTTNNFFSRRFETNLYFFHAFCSKKKVTYQSYISSSSSHFVQAKGDFNF